MNYSITLNTWKLPNIKLGDSYQYGEKKHKIGEIRKNDLVLVKRFKNYYQMTKGNHYETYVLKATSDSFKPVQTNSVRIQNSWSRYFDCVRVS